MEDMSISHFNPSGNESELNDQYYLNSGNMFLDYDNVLESIYPSEVYETTIENDLPDFDPNPNVISGNLKTENGSSQEETEDVSSITSLNHHSPSSHSSQQQELVCIVLHKPRGSKGAWLPITMNQRIRVTQVRGKNVQIILRGTNEKVLNDISLYLEDKADNVWRDITEKGFSIETKHTIQSESNSEYPNHSYYLQFNLKLYAIHKTLSFKVDFCDSEGNLQSLRSVTFQTHNSGRRETSKKRGFQKSDPSKVQDDDVIPSKKMFKSDIAEIKDQPTLSLSSQSISPSIQAALNDWTVIDANLCVNGDIRAKSFLQYSDLRLKTSISDIVDAMSIVTSLKGKSFQWKKGVCPSSSETGGKRVIGLIAQEVQEVLPEVVEEVDDILSVNYTEIIPVLIEALKEQSSTLEKFKDGIEAQVSDIKQTLNRICEKEKLERNNSVNNNLQYQKQLASEHLSQFINHVERLSIEFEKKNVEDKKQCKVDLSGVHDGKKKNNGLFQRLYHSSKMWKILTCLLFALLVIGGVAIAIYFGVFRKGKNTPILSNNLLLSPSFEDLDSHGKASGWIGPYWLLAMRDVWKRNHETWNLRIIPDDNDESSWPFDIRPHDGNIMLEIFMNDTLDSSYFYARTEVPLFNLEEKDSIKYFNISTYATSHFNLTTSQDNSVFQMNVIVNYKGREFEVFGIDFSHTQQNGIWNYNEINIPRNPNKKIDYLEVILVSTYQGYSFWDNVKAHYVVSDLPEHVNFATQRTLKECFGITACT